MDYSLALTGQVYAKHAINDCIRLEYARLFWPVFHANEECVFMHGGVGWHSKHSLNEPAPSKVYGWHTKQKLVLARHLSCECPKWHLTWPSGTL